MTFKNLQAVMMYCQNCGHKAVGYRSHNRTARFGCERCGAVWVSKRMDGHTVDTRLTAPQEQAVFW